MTKEAHPTQNLEHMLWVADYPLHGARKFPNRPAIIGDNDTVTYAELERKSETFVDFLHERQIAPGSRIAYLGKNSELFFPVFFGCLRSGVILVPINWRCAPGEIAFILRDSGSQLLIYDAEFAEKVAQALPEIPNPPRLLITTSEDGDSLRQILLSHPTSRDASREGTTDACALLMYTSGTTGSPKGVMLSHKALSIARHVEVDSPDWADWNDDDIILSAMPNFHVGGLSWMLIGLMRSVTCVLTADASPATLLRLMRRHAVTRTFMVPTVVRMVLEQVTTDASPPPPIRTIYYGASTMDVALLSQCIDTLGCGFAQYFGMTENCGTVTFLPPRDHDVHRPEKLRSVGKALPGMTIEIRDTTGSPLPPHTPGEIWIQSPTLTSGYWNRPEATEAVLVDDWYRTGDGGYVDEEGYLYLTDRIKDMIISGGENVYPAEVEQALRLHPAVSDVAVVGIPDPTWGEVVAAVVEWHVGESASLAELRTFASKYIASYKLPKILESVSNLPRTATGKIQRVKVRACVTDGFADNSNDK
ncbi:long-chain-fatty-acid--CoA ligase [Burkholderia sp. Ac-20353]|uniref:long-chain-fatty-acid--CoA ligase n=1 Tax=Burkholderia sp. Ac-20353 TaxID=2703894 RepID=UPI00197B173F|nr:long-chain-fatty-acid--CoA ligase [Burkholderia sp. Ac-20353]MBN3788516.1 long-chain-fatty-acid--CoA ligase [Burkholderia sp. Ac-20353]